MHKAFGRNESHRNGVAWGDWTFSVTQRPSTGVAVNDIRFRGERVVYELLGQSLGVGGCGFVSFSRLFSVVFVWLKYV